ncbi:hypothetical protein V5E97_10525 [Singulisphaera sp. Ch08]|uniref:DUF4175 domain-containing protein n=1 Tax=Singulisphaera sp. Ch08 TaxID=3120278 RepID=A0AAU7CMS8_9BACT
MRENRLTIARLLGLILFFGVIFAGLRSGSNDWFKLTYSLTFLALVYAAIAARYRGAFWYGFAVAGWAYFVVGFGPWIGSPPLTEPLRAVNRNLVSSVVLEIVSGTMSRHDSSPSGSRSMLFAMHWANRDGIGHCVLTVLFAIAGGLGSRSLARSRTSEG